SARRAGPPTSGRGASHARAPATDGARPAEESGSAGRLRRAGSSTTSYHGRPNCNQVAQQPGYSPSSAAAPDMRGRGPLAQRATTRAKRAPPSRKAKRGEGLQVPAEGLFALDRLEERLEVAVAEAAGAVALDDLEEHGRTVLRGLREDLQQVAVVVAVREDPQAPQVVPALVDLADALRGLVVVRLGRRKEDHPAARHLVDGLDDVRALHGDVLCTRAVVELEVLVDLALALTLGRLVDRELDLPLAVRHHLRHQRGVLGRDVVVAEVDHL